MTVGNGVITGAVVAHQGATVEEIQSTFEGKPGETAARLAARDGVTEAFALGTCNRAEAYVVTHAGESGRDALEDILATVPDGTRFTGHEESLRHLLRVAAGLESMVLGEDQILGQLRDAHAAAAEAGTVGPVLDEALTKALHVGERARTETGINDGVRSIGSAAADLAASERDLEGATAMVIGAGEMSRHAAHALAGTGVGTVLIANRTRETAEHLAAAIDGADGRVVAFDDLDSHITRADVVVSATASETPVIDERTAADADALIVDIAQPRDVAPGVDDIGGVTVRTIDALEAVVDRTRDRRAAAAREVEALIDREFERLLDQYKRARVEDVIAAMHRSAERTKAREVDTALAKLEARGDLPPEQRAVVEDLADALVSQLMAAPTRSLQEAAVEDDWTTISTALRLFDPEFEDGPPDALVEALLDEEESFEAS